ncbi:Zinc finger MIZ domain-containing protein 1 [Thelotrema lepadinum]|nr:Zinc finger MIZ domain-containing protein 1 [Thelotrema lepadinum]
MIPRKRPRTGEADAPGNMANREIEMSNSTLQTFLNPSQKSWMTPGNVSSNSKSQARPSKPANKGQEIQRGRPVSKLNTNFTTTNVASNGTSAISSAPAASPSNTGQVNKSSQRPKPIQTSATPMARNVVDLVANAECSPIQRTTVLPSPAPSEDGTRNSDDAIESGSGPLPPAAPASRINQSAAQNSPESPAAGGPSSTEGLQSSLPAADVAVSSRSASATPNAENDRLRELAARYGGIDQLERQLEVNRRASITQRSNPQSPLGQTPIQSPRTIEANAQRPRNPSSGLTTPIQQGRIAPPQPLRTASHPSPTWPAAAAQHSMQQNAQIAPPQRSPSLPMVSNDFGFEGFLNKLAARSVVISTSRTLDPQKKPLEDGRLRLLAEACQTRDVSYLRIHQLFCLRNLPTFCFEQWITKEEKEGFDVLSGLLVSNNQFDPTSVQWYANFPLPCPQTPGDFVEAFSGIRASLRGIGSQWPQFREHHQKNGSIPFVDDVLRRLLINSKVLQRVIYKSIYRSFWPGPEDECFDQSVRLFESSQEQFNTWLQSYGGTIPAQIIASWHKSLSEKYRTFAAQHARHINLTVTSSDGGVQCDPRFITVTQGQPAPPGPMAPNIDVRTPLAFHNTITYQNSSVPIPMRGGVLLSQRRQSSSQSSHSAPQPSITNQDMRRQPANQPLAHQRVQSRTISQPTGATTNTHQRRRSSNNLVTDIPAVQQSHSYASPNQSSQAALQGPQIINSNNDTFNAQGIIRHFHSQQTQPMLPGQTPNRNPPLFPTAHSRQLHPPQNHQLGIPLHQSHLQDVISLPSDEASSSRNQKMFSYLEGFLVEPAQIKPITQNVRAKFTVDNQMYSRLPPTKNDNVFGGPRMRKLGSNSVLIRVRCIRDKMEPLTESVWAVTETEWPPSMVLMVNEQCLQVRRKADWGKDLAVDLTATVKQGENAIQASFLKNPQTPENKHCYALAVEILAVCFESSLKSYVQQLPPAETKERIRKQLNTSDEEVEVISDDLVIKVIDPFSFKLVTNPVRGRNCPHNECFDLDIFLQTLKANPLFPEQFRCPWCHGDARPTNLLADGWFMEVLGKIKQAGEHEAQAIVVDKEARWKVKEEEKEGESGDGTGTKLKSRKQSSGRAPSEAMVIDSD